MSLDAIASELKELKDYVVLIFAFNATGKTRLSVAYKNATKDSETGKHTGVYYKTCLFGIMMKNMTVQIYG
jgi:hypothetical protein